MNLPRDEMAFRKIYEDLVKNEKLIIVFRPGNRIYPNRRGYIKGEIVTARIIEKCGCDEKKIPPTFNGIKKKIRIENIRVVNIETLNNIDFRGSSPDVQDIFSLKKHLSAIYEKPENYYDGKEITQIELTYLSS